MGSMPPIQNSLSLKENATLRPMGYSIQVGAFSEVNNAIRLTSYLQDKGFDAYYFINDSKLYRVRFGDYSSFNSARIIAEELISNGIITEYLIIKPEDYPGIGLQKTFNDNLRKDLVLSAKKFIGVPYYWGGISNKTGFDCSGLTMAVYKLNGLNLPRTTSEQWSSGNPVDDKHLSEGDLVFFSTKRAGEISHVGIYVGSGEFIHAPGKGKRIRAESLLNEYFQKSYIGARSYLQ